MIFSLDDAKVLLSLDVNSTDQDESLTSIIDSVASFIEGETKRRFDTPIAIVEYQRGTGHRDLYLNGHIDLSAGTPPSSADITVSERVRYGDWEVITDYERRDDVLVRTPFEWSIYSEFKMAYNDGYLTTPADLTAVIRELIISTYNAIQATITGSRGITSETLVGVYSYTIALPAQFPAALGGGALSMTAQRTLNRYKRLLV